MTQNTDQTGAKMTTDCDPVERCKDFLISRTELREQMLDVASSVRSLPYDCDTLDFRGSRTNPNTLRAIWELKRVGLVDYGYESEVDHVQVAEGPALAEWLIEQLDGKASQDERTGDGEIKNHETPVYLGQGRMRVGDAMYSFEGQEHYVLDALINVGAATTSELRKQSGVPDAVKVLKGLCKKYDFLKHAISLPGRRNNGGYRTTIRRMIEQN